MSMASQRWDGSHQAPPEAAAQWLLAGVLVLAPLAFGGTEAWAQEVLIVAVVLALLATVLHVGREPRRRFARSWALVPVVIFLGVATLQAVPLPLAVVSLVSPETVRLRGELLAGLPPGVERGEWVTLSFYPHGTWSTLRLLLLPVGVFLLVINLVRTPEAAARLLWAMVAAGGATAGLVMVQVVTGQGGGVEPGIAHAYAGPFLNRGHLAQFLNISIGAAVSLVLIEVTQIHRAGLDARSLWSGVTGRLNRFRLVVLVGYIVWAALMVVFSLSRGGVVAMLASGTLVGGYLGWRSRSRAQGSIFWVLGLLLLGVLLTVSFDVAYDRLATLRNIDAASGGRWDILRDLVAAWRDFPVLGTGLGTFAYLFPLYDRGTVSAVTTHAENEYAHLMLEVGGVGVAVVLGFVGIVLWKLAGATWRPQRRLQWAAFGLGFSFIAVLIHSFTDFGAHTPAVAMATAAICGLICRADRSTPLDMAEGASRHHRGHWMGVVTQPRVAVAGLAVAAAGGWWIVSADGARRAEAAMAEVGPLADTLAHDPTAGSDEQYVRLISGAAAAAELQPGNIDVVYNLNLYRWWATSRVVIPETGEVLLTPEQVRYVEQVVQRLQEARLACPSHGSTLLLAGQLSNDVLDRADASSLFTLGQRLSPQDPLAAMYLAREAIAEGRVDDAVALLTRAAAIDGRLRDGAMRAMIADLGRPDLAMDMARGDRGLLLHLANMLETVDGVEGLLDEARREARRLLEVSAGRENADAASLAALGIALAAEGQPGRAETMLRRAVALNYGQVHWRLELSHTLAELGKLDEAVREAQIAVRLKPDYKPARLLVDQLAKRIEDARPRD